jgi:hypothetical protein
LALDWIPAFPAGVCDEAWCMNACPVNAIAVDPVMRAKVVLDRVCVGCHLCTIACPFGTVFTLEDFVKAGERAWNLERLWNLRAGLTAKDDNLPEQLRKGPHRSGPAKGVGVHLDQMPPVYYQQRGRDEQGVPTPGKLLELGLASVGGARLMSKAKARDGRPVFDPKKFSFMKRLQEIGVFFEKRSPQHKTMRRLAQRLKKAGIPYAIMGAMAVNAHGARRTTDDVDVLLTEEGFQEFKEEFVDEVYDTVERRPRRFVEKQSGVTVDCLITGRYPGSGKPGPFAFPSPEEASVEIEKVRVVNLPQLIQLKLAARRYYDFGDVVLLIRTHDLDESFLKNLHPSVHQDFIECLEEKRRDDEYEAQE